MKLRTICAGHFRRSFRAAAEMTTMVSTSEDYHALGDCQPSRLTARSGHAEPDCPVGPSGTLDRVPWAIFRAEAAPLREGLRHEGARSSVPSESSGLGPASF